MLYYAVANVLTDLHSGRYNDDPAFNGMKFTSLIQTSKADNDYHIDVVPAIDAEGTMWAFYDDVVRIIVLLLLIRRMRLDGSWRYGITLLASLI